jgi:hypothetical protein
VSHFFVAAAIARLLIQHRFHFRCQRIDISCLRVVELCRIQRVGQRAFGRLSVIRGHLSFQKFRCWICGRGRSRSGSRSGSRCRSRLRFLRGRILRAHRSGAESSQSNTGSHSQNQVSAKHCGTLPRPLPERPHSERLHSERLQIMTRESYHSCNAHERRILARAGACLLPHATSQRVETGVRAYLPQRAARAHPHRVGRPPLIVINCAVSYDVPSIAFGGVGKRLTPAVLKTVRPERVSWVRIPPPPPATSFCFTGGTWR